MPEGNPFILYKPNSTLADRKYTLLDPIFDKSEKQIIRVEIKEKTHDIVGHVLAATGGIVLFTLLILNINNIKGAESFIAKAFVLCISIILCIFLFNFLLENLKKFIDKNNIDRVIIYEEGIMLKNKAFNWNKIKKVKIKVFESSKEHDDAYLLILDNNDKIIDYNISLLYTKERKLFPDQKYIALRKGLGHYLK